jgi:hypothetical protein
MKPARPSPPLAAALLLLGLVACRSAEPEDDRGGVETLRWLSGTWVGDLASSTYEENWSSPAGGAMLGTARELKDGRMVSFEHLRIEERGGEVFYVAAPGGANPIDFRAVRLGPREAVFENPEHDFPVRILYRLEPDGSLRARAEGRDGQGLDFPMRRMR